MMAVSKDRRLRLRRPFTLAEAAVVVLVGRGRRYPEIGAQLQLSPFTVEAHARSVAEKIIDGPDHDAFAALRPWMRIYEWVRGVEGSRIAVFSSFTPDINTQPEVPMT
jgi:DNA-binding CsgD family transcriptional regulator